MCRDHLRRSPSLTKSSHYPPAPPSISRHWRASIVVLNRGRAMGRPSDAISSCDVEVPSIIRADSDDARTDPTTGEDLLPQINVPRGVSLVADAHRHVMFATVRRAPPCRPHSKRLSRSSRHSNDRVWLLRASAEASARDEKKAVLPELGTGDRA